MRLACTALLSLMLAACGGGGSDSTPAPTPESAPAPAPPPVPPAPPPPPPPPPARGSLIGEAALVPVSAGGATVNTFEPAMFAALLESAQAGASALVGPLKCGVTTYRVKYNTAAGASEATNASTAVMVPSGLDPACSGARPVLLYAHGTSFDKAYDMAAVSSTEARLVAAMFAARGFVVVAPNYAGYAGSAAAYHPYLDGEAQANDMLDALRAARLAFGALKVNDSGKLFLSGYSQGGYVALATQRAMQAAPAGEFKVSAVAALSGPYALLDMGDTIFGGAPSGGSSVFLPLLIDAGQRAGAGLYASTAELYEAAYLSAISDVLLATGTRLPQVALFAAGSQPQVSGFGAFFGEGNLIKSSYRETYLTDLVSRPCHGATAAPRACSPSHPLRKWLQKNDLRNFTPAAPLLLCGGRGDPVVPYANTRLTAEYFRANGAGANVTELELDTAPGSTDPYRKAKQNFLTLKTALALDAVKKGEPVELAVATAYHAGLVAPVCLDAARDFFLTQAGP